MQQLIKRLLKDNILYIALAFSIFILVFSLIPVKSNLLGNVENSDKILHTTAYTFLSLSWFFYFKPFKNIQKKGLIVLGLFIYGIIIEILQSTLTTYRTGSFYDVLANSIGILIALISFEKVYKIALSKNN
ncbi:MAG: VanZ family protein [Flavobacteriaceae bacterium]